MLQRRLIGPGSRLNFERCGSITFLQYIIAKHKNLRGGRVTVLEGIIIISGEHNSVCIVMNLIFQSPRVHVTII